VTIVSSASEPFGVAGAADIRAIIIDALKGAMGDREIDHDIDVDAIERAVRDAVAKAFSEIRVTTPAPARGR